MNGDGSSWQAKHEALLKSSRQRELELESRLKIVSEAARKGVESERLLRKKLAEERVRRECSEASAAELWDEAGALRLKTARYEAELEKFKPVSDALAETLAENRELRRKVAALEKKLNIRKGTEDPFGLGTPSSRKTGKPNAKAENLAKRGGAVPGHKGHGHKPFSGEDADETVLVSPAPAGNCCASPALTAAEPVRRAVYDFQPMALRKLMIVEEVSRCTNCGAAVSGRAPGIMPGAAHTNRAVALALAEVYFHQQTLGQVSRRFGIRKGTLIEMAHRTATFLTPVFLMLAADLRRAGIVHADETGWTMDGLKAYAWLFLSATEKIFLFRRSRGAKEAETVIGKEKLFLVLVTDRYCGYHPLKVLRQYCFVHLDRDVKKLALEFPDDPHIRLFCAAMREQITGAIKLQAGSPPLSEYLEQASRIKDEIMKLCEAPARDPGIQALQDIFRENGDRLWHWVDDPAIPCHNNNGERALRPVVIARKLSFGCQSEKGMATREILMSVLHTAQCRGQDPAQCLARILDTLAENPDADVTAIFPQAHGQAGQVA